LYGIKILKNIYILDSIMMFILAGLWRHKRIYNYQKVNYPLNVVAT